MFVWRFVCMWVWISKAVWQLQRNKKGSEYWQQYSMLFLLSTGMHTLQWQVMVPNFLNRSHGRETTVAGPTPLAGD